MTPHLFRRAMLAVAICGSIGLPTASAQSAAAPSPAAPAQTLITNARVFDGRSDQLSGSLNVLIEGNLIKQISRAPVVPGRAPP